MSLCLLLTSIKGSGWMHTTPFNLQLNTQWYSKQNSEKSPRISVPWCLHPVFNWWSPNWVNYFFLVNGKKTLNKNSLQKEWVMGLIVWRVQSIAPGKAKIVPKPWGISYIVFRVRKRQEMNASTQMLLTCFIQSKIPVHGMVSFMLGVAPPISSISLFRGSTYFSWYGV